MADDWITTTLGEVATIVIGRTPPRDQSRYWSTSLERPFCTIADMNSWAVTPRREGVTEEAEIEGKAKRVPRGSLLMSFKLTIGRVGFAAVDLFPNEAIAWLQVAKGAAVDPMYLAIWLEHLDLYAHAGLAVKGRTLNSTSLRSIPVSFPPSLREQQRIVDFVVANDRATAAARKVNVKASAAFDALLSDPLTGARAIGCEVVRLGDLLTEASDPIAIEESASYETVGVLSYGRGLFRRPVVTGADTSYKTYFRIHAGQFVYSKLFAWEGALAVVPKELDGLFVSQEFPVFDIDRTRLVPAFLSYLCEWPPLWSRVRAGEAGMGGRRKRVHPTKLLAVEIPLPPVSEQLRHVAVLDAARGAADAAKAEYEALGRLRMAIVDDLLAGRVTLSKSYDDVLEAAS